MKYTNPIIHMDYSDPDVIRVNDDYFMVSSSFNMVPGIPILHSKNLVNWEIINYVFDRIPFDGYDQVKHGNGAWAPSIRYHKNTYYCIIPFPDEGIYVSKTNDIYGLWSPLFPLIKGKGIIDPCPIWDNDKCYLIVGFAKSRIGFNSVLGLYEVSNDLTKPLTDYKIIYDGHNNNPTIEGPKIYKRNDYYYIMAPAGSVKTGWQVALRSKDIYGPYESKIVLLQNDTIINGPHQGALIELNDNLWAFIHFQDKGCYGRVVHLQPVKWINDWPICGNIKDDSLGGSPVLEHDYLIDIKSNYKLKYKDDFKSKNLLWQRPSNYKAFYKIDNGLIIYNHNNLYNDELNLCQSVLMQKVMNETFNVSVNLDLSNMSFNSEAGIVVTGSIYNFISIKKEKDLVLYIGNGMFGQKDQYIKIGIVDKKIALNIKFMKMGSYKFGINGKILDNSYIAYPGRWIGSSIGLFSKGENDSKGYAIFSDFIME